MKRKRLLLAVTTPFALLTAAWGLSLMTPDWYAPQASDDLETEAVSERIEFRVQQELHRIRSKEPRWTLHLPDDVTNAWLATRLQSWLQGHAVQWPKAVGLPQVRCRQGVVEIAATMRELDGRVCSLDLVPSMNANGVLLTPGWVVVGLLPLPLPASLILSNDLSLPFIEAPASTDIDLMDNRIVRITAIRPIPGALEIDLITSDPAVP